MSTLTILERARAIITPRERWTQRSFARLPSGAACSPGDPDASCFCLTGAVVHARYQLDAEHEDCARACAAISAHTNGYPIPMVNDNSTHEGVLALLDKAIETARAAS